MGSRFARLLLVLGIVSGLFFGSFGTSFAIPGPHYLYFPWVPNGDMLGTMGPFYGAITVQNLESTAVDLYIGVSGGGAPVSQPLAAYTAKTLTAEEIGVPTPGAAVFVYAEKLDLSPARVAGVQKQSSPVAPQGFRTGEAHQVVDGYTGFTEDDLLDDTTYVLPIVQTNSGWNTKIRVSNVRLSQSTTATVSIRPAGGGSSYNIHVGIGPGGTATVDVQTLDLGPEFVGSATVTSDPALPLGVVAERYKASTNMLIINAARPANSCQALHLAPLVFDDYFNWNTGISVLNRSATEVNNVTVTYLRTDGTVADTRKLTIEPASMSYIYTPATGTGSGFVGAATIHGTQTLCAVVDEVKYTGSGGDVGHAMSYPTSASLAGSGGRGVIIPIYQKGSQATGLGDTSGIQLFNPGLIPVDAYVWVTFRNQQGGHVLSQEFTVEDMASRTLYALNLDIPDDFQGYVTIYTAGADVIAVSNNVNYAVGYDGSVSYTMVIQRNQ